MHLTGKETQVFNKKDLMLLPFPHHKVLQREASGKLHKLALTVI